jgi:hypothetical protein
MYSFNELIKDTETKDCIFVMILLNETSYHRQHIRNQFAKMKLNLNAHIQSIREKRKRKKRRDEWRWVQSDSVQFLGRCWANQQSIQELCNQKKQPIKHRHNNFISLITDERENERESKRGCVRVCVTNKKICGLRDLIAAVQTLWCSVGVMERFKKTKTSANDDLKLSPICSNVSPKMKRAA